MRRLPADILLAGLVILIAVILVIATAGCRIIIAGGPVSQADGNQYGTNKAVNLKVH